MTDVNTKMTSQGFTGFTDDDITTIRKANVSTNEQDTQRPKTNIRSAKLQSSGRSTSREMLGMVRTPKSATSYAPLPPGARLSYPKETALCLLSSCGTCLPDPEGQVYCPAHARCVVNHRYSTSYSGYQDPEPSSPSPSSGYRTPESLQSSSSLPSSPVQVSPCKSPTGNHPKNVKIRLRENNSYEVISANVATTQDQPDSTKQESEEQFDHGIGEDNERVDEASLEKFQKRQKMMEEQNRRRRELLSKAIADRSRRTQSEAQKLKQIQAELAKLDTLLSTDVSILRDQIEVASLEFNEAQKRYDKAEKEFIDAKLQMFNRLERKELLTEHLCRIIEANELRKANKLSELMAKLEMVDCVSEIPEASIEEILPHLRIVDEVTYAACTTLKDPKKNTTVVQTNLAISNCDNIQESTKQKSKEENNVKHEEKVKKTSCEEEEGGGCVPNEEKIHNVQHEVILLNEENGIEKLELISENSSKTISNECIVECKVNINTVDDTSETCRASGDNS